MDEKELPVIPCGVALIRDGRRFLVAQRRDDDSFGSFWEFPGGRKNDDESWEECVAREVKEEIGIEVSVKRPYMEIRRRHHERIVWLNFFLCEPVSGQPRAIDCQKVEWADVDSLGGYKFPPANEQVIEKLKAEYSK